MIAPATREFLVAAGLAPGMCVLDVGSGTGSVALLAADLVGPRGSVIGTDIAAAAVASATAAAEARQLPNVTFHAGDPTELRFGQRFDAIVGRYVLVFQPEP